jgi:hypothetical protein
MPQDAMVPIQPEPENRLDEEERVRRLRQRICFLLDAGSCCLFALFLIQLLPILIESKPTDPDWQGLLVAQFVQQGVLAFLGFVLLHLAVFLNHKKQHLRRRLRNARHLALAASIGFILLIPLQLASSLQALRTVQLKRSDNAAQVTRLMEIRELILKAQSSQDINYRLKSLLEPELPPEQQVMKLSDLQTVLLRENERRQSLLAPLIRDEVGQFSPLALMISRVAAAVAWSAAFAAGAVPFGSKTTLLESLLRR